MRAYVKWLLTGALVSVTAVATSAHAADVMRVKTMGAYRVELHVLPAEPFFSKADVAAKQPKEGMQIEGGATPVMPDAASHPNHHLVVHVFDKKTHQAITDATVTMRFASTDGKGKPAGVPIEVPVVVMQAIGKGPSSTHYGNNVTMPAGRYQVTVAVNSQSAVFDVAVSDAPSTPMGHMKM
ncbi:MAG TPA: hypothetical protein VF742_10040 [Terracidiphilus sp.]